MRVFKVSKLYFFLQGLSLKPPSPLAVALLQLLLGEFLLALVGSPFGDDHPVRAGWPCGAQLKILNVSILIWMLMLTFTFNIDYMSNVAVS